MTNEIEYHEYVTESGCRVLSCTPKTSMICHGADMTKVSGETTEKPWRSQHKRKGNRNGKRNKR